MVLAGGVRVAAQGQQQGPLLNVLAGQGDGTIAVEQFFGDPGMSAAADRIRVAVGTTINWTIGSDEQHTITFLAGRPRPAVIVAQPEDPTGRPPLFNGEVFLPSPPMGPWDGSSYVNSAPIGRGETFAVTFTRADTYPYVCLFHPAMTGMVEVVPAASSNITTQAALDQYVASHYNQAHASQIRAITERRSAPDVADGPAGSKIWSVRAGTDWRNGHLDIMAFLPGQLTVSQGDTVVWYVDHPAPHTVTFLAPGQPHPDEVIPSLPDGTPLSPAAMGAMMGEPGMPPTGPPDPSMAPRLVFGPGVLRNAPSLTYDGRGFYNSGFLGDPVLWTAGVPLSNTWALTFDTPGSFEYICVLHDSLGMKGTITVLPR